MGVTGLHRGFTDKVVIVDDGYRDVDLTMIDGADFSEFFEVVLAEHRWEELKKDVFSEFPDLGLENLFEHEDAVRAAWSYYQGDFTSKHPYLEIMFRQLLADVGMLIAPLKPLVNYLENELGLVVKRFSSVEAAADEIRSCRLVFLDFYLAAGSSEEMLRNIERHKDLLSSKVTPDGSPRFVYLMSSQLPDKPIVERFRQITSLREALFRAVRKESFQEDWMRTEFLSRAELYQDVAKVEIFLAAFGSAIKASSESLMRDIVDLELYDLSILNSMRLYKEEESYAEYLGWLFSEALSAKIRNSNLLSLAGQGVNDIKLTPFSGLLEPRSLLFKLYSEIAFSHTGPQGQFQKVHFGDVYQAYPKIQERPFKMSSLRKRAASRRGGVKSWRDIHLSSDKGLTNTSSFNDSDQLLLVISPACDLIRCYSDEYQVTCVRGTVVHSAPRLADLFDQKYVFGENKHVLRIETPMGEKYQVINWNPKDIITIPFGLLRNTSIYLRKARMNELFCHELKESALRILGRVGVPVDPSFSIPLAAVFNFKVGNDFFRLAAPPSKFVSAVRLAGNKLNEKKIVFTEEFNSWFGDALRTHFAAQEVPKKYSKIASLFQKGVSVEFSLEKNKEPSLIDGVGKLIYLNEFTERECTIDSALYVFPWAEVNITTVH
ncbi:hypothetical protein [Pseudomonas sp. CFBP 13710]|uniref:hypothetical protein n=1 Tax=Pseudomonas sp. CFBP 13710 TaxID=2775311 RepID=UPI001780E164|nr:hypothetical protein [Pseudomonas sp. CFBP 13710]MBD8733208.1 hypothetical protein [Pseudomonas sp. CFBP 13710]